MNLSAERMAFIRRQIESGVQLEQDAILDLQGHNDHLIQIWEARGRLLLITERERDQLKAEVERLTNNYRSLCESAVQLNTSATSAGDEVARLKAENEEMVIALNEILKVTPMGVEAFGIAALVLGELGVSKEAQS